MKQNIKSSEKLNKLILRKGRFISWLPVLIGCVLVVFIWSIQFIDPLVTSLLGSNFEKIYQISEPKNRVWWTPKAMSICTLTVFNPCGLEYSFEHVTEDDFSLIKNQATVNGYTGFSEGYTSDTIIGEGKLFNYDYRRNHDGSATTVIEGVKDVDGKDEFLGLIYYPELEILDTTWFDY